MQTTPMIGTPNYGNTGTNSRPNAANANWRLDKEGSHIYRILPPFGQLASQGRWSQYESLHWGPTLSSGKKRAFRCIQKKNRKTQMIEQECPMCKMMDEQRNALYSLEKELKEKGKGKVEIEEATKPLSDWLQSYNLQKGHFLNVIRPDGQIGRLFIKIKCKQALDLKIPLFIEKGGCDIMSVDGGLWLEFKRSGMGRHDTTYDVDLVEEVVEVNGRKLRDVKRAPLTQEVIDRMTKEAFDLADYYKTLTFDEVQMMVSSGFDPETVDLVFGVPTTSPSKEVDEEDDVDPPAPVAQKATSQDNEAAALAAMALSKQKTNPTPSKGSSMSTEDFVKAFGPSK